MFDIGWSELAVIAAVAIVVIGPKDLPLALKTVGQWVAKARSLAREFQGSVDEMIREAERAAELDKLKKEVQEATAELDVTKEIETAKNEIERSIDMPPIQMDPTKEPDAQPAAEKPAGEKPVESIAAPPPDAPVMPLPSTMVAATAEGHVENPAEAQKPAAVDTAPKRATGGQF
ncbi:MAG: twin-arginine translocase subunit TatB [Alphaproteobacteria bacterium]|nr:twin-arginine translocase subunit TatB [Alphaproteobacteria bacterium]